MCAISTTAGINYLEVPVISALSCPMPIEIYALMAYRQPRTAGRGEPWYSRGESRYDLGCKARWMRSLEEWGREVERNV